MTTNKASVLPIPRSGVVVVITVIIAFLLVGSIADYAVSAWAYTPNTSFGTLFAAYGEAPSLMGLVAAGTLAFRAQPPVHRVLVGMLTVGGGALITVGTVALVFRPEENWDSPTPVRTLIAMGLAAATIYITTRASRAASWQAMCVVAGALFAVVAVEMVTVQGLKMLWERPRMRMITDTGAPFAPWWSPGYADKQSLLDQGVDPSEFASFPSGHTANAAVALALSAFGLLSNRAAVWAKYLWWVGAGWLVVVGVSRVVAGAHFLTDIAVGMAIGLGVVWVVLALAVRVLDSGILDRLVTTPAAGSHPVRHGS